MCILRKCVSTWKKRVFLKVLIYDIINREFLHPNRKTNAQVMTFRNAVLGFGFQNGSLRNNGKIEHENGFKI